MRPSPLPAVKNNITGELDRPLDPTTSVYRNIVRKYGLQTGVSAQVNGLCVHSLCATAATNALSQEADFVSPKVLSLQRPSGRTSCCLTFGLPKIDGSREGVGSDCHSQRFATTELALSRHRFFSGEGESTRGRRFFFVTPPTAAFNPHVGRGGFVGESRQPNRRGGCATQTKAQQCGNWVAVPGSGRSKVLEVMAVARSMLRRASSMSLPSSSPV